MSPRKARIEEQGASGRLGGVKKTQKNFFEAQKSLSSVICFSSTIFQCGFESAIKKKSTSNFFLAGFFGLWAVGLSRVGAGARPLEG